MKTLRPLFAVALLVASTSALFAHEKLLNVSYDPTRELFAEINPAFISHYPSLEIEQSHGGSAKQAQAVIDGLKADVVTLALAPDIDLLAKNKLLKEDWQAAFPFNAAPYTSTIVFVVRQNNPKAVKDWSDLTRSDVGVVTPNPKTSGGARWNYLAAWGFGLKSAQQDESKAQDFVQRIFDRVVALDSGARGSTISFAEKNLGDVLITWENEAYQIQKTYPDANYQIVIPSLSILAEPVVAVVDAVVDERGTREAATAYLNFLYTYEAQEIIAKNFYRPRNADIAKKYEDVLKPVELFTIDESFGGWENAQKVHFSDGGKLDQILAQRGQH